MEHNELSFKCWEFLCIVTVLMVLAKRERIKCTKNFQTRKSIWLIVSSRNWHTRSLISVFHWQKRKIFWNKKGINMSKMYTWTVTHGKKENVTNLKLKKTFENQIFNNICFKEINICFEPAIISFHWYLFSKIKYLFWAR